MSHVFTRLALAAVATVSFAGAAEAVTIYNNITVYDGSNMVVASVTGDFVASPSLIIFVGGIAVDSARFGDFSTVFNAGLGSYVNIFGIATGGPDGFNLALSGPGLAGPSSHEYIFTGAPISATDYLSAGLQDSGYTAFITVAGVPEPESWALLIAGFGLVGAAQRRRSRAARAA